MFEKVKRAEKSVSDVFAPKYETASKVIKLKTPLPLWCLLYSTFSICQYFFSKKATFFTEYGLQMYCNYICYLWTGVIMLSRQTCCIILNTTPQYKIQCNLHKNKTWHGLFLPHICASNDNEAGRKEKAKCDIIFTKPVDKKKGLCYNMHRKYC